MQGKLEISQPGSVEVFGPRDGVVGFCKLCTVVLVVGLPSGTRGVGAFGAQSRAFAGL